MRRRRSGNSPRSMESSGGRSGRCSAWKFRRCVLRVRRRLEELQRRISDFLKNGEAIPELDLALPETFDLRDAGTAYATAVSRNHNTIWMM